MAREPVGVPGRMLRAAAAACTAAPKGPSGSGGGGTTGDVTALPLVEPADLTCLGAFRLPEGTFGSANGFSYSRGPIAYDEATGALFAGGHPYDTGSNFLSGAACDSAHQTIYLLQTRAVV